MSHTSVCTTVSLGSMFGSVCTRQRVSEQICIQVYLCEYLCVCIYLYRPRMRRGVLGLHGLGTSLVVRRVRLCSLIQEAWVPSLAGELDPTCLPQLRARVRDEYPMSHD